MIAHLQDGPVTAVVSTSLFERDMSKTDLNVVTERREGMLREEGGATEIVRVKTHLLMMAMRRSTIMNLLGDGNGSVPSRKNGWVQRWPITCGTCLGRRDGVRARMGPVSAQATYP